MSEPTPTTARVWDGLPEAYRDADAVQAPTAYPLRRYLSLVTDRLDVVVTTLDRINRRGPAEGGRPDATSDLADPRTADAAWLPWLAQLVGVSRDILGSLTEAQRRAAISDASAGWRSGTMPGLIRATRSLLTPSSYGAGYVRVLRDPADPWHLTIVTAPAETPQGGPRLLAQLVAARVKPAGVVLTWQAYVASWDVVEAMFPTWDRLEAANPWDHIETAYPVA